MSEDHNKFLMFIDLSCNFQKGKHIFKTTSKLSIFSGKKALNTKVNLLVVESKRIPANLFLT